MRAFKDDQSNCHNERPGEWQTVTIQKYDKKVWELKILSQLISLFKEPRNFLHEIVNGGLIDKTFLVWNVIDV